MRCAPSSTVVVEEEKEEEAFSTLEAEKNALQVEVERLSSKNERMKTHVMEHKKVILSTFVRSLQSAYKMGTDYGRYTDNNDETKKSMKKELLDVLRKARDCVNKLDQIE